MSPSYKLKQCLYNSYNWILLYIQNILETLIYRVINGDLLSKTKYQLIWYKNVMGFNNDIIHGLKKTI